MEKKARGILKSGCGEDLFSPRDNSLIPGFPAGLELPCRWNQEKHMSKKAISSGVVHKIRADLRNALTISCAGNLVAQSNSPSVSGQLFSTPQVGLRLSNAESDKGALVVSGNDRELHFGLANFSNPINRRLFFFVSLDALMIAGLAGVNL